MLDGCSGVARRLDILSPKIWAKEACEHIYEENIKTQNLITHELFHVYHGQANVSPDFSETYDIDWFVEGFATYASGQCDSVRISEVKKSILENTIPQSLNDFWTGELRYGLSGSTIKFIDDRYGRSKLRTLLKFNKKSEILDFLVLTEINFLKEWKAFMQVL